MSLNELVRYQATVIVMCTVLGTLALVTPSPWSLICISANVVVCLLDLAALVAYAHTGER